MPGRDGSAQVGAGPVRREGGPINSFGLGEALAGLAGGFVLASLAVAVVDGLAHGRVGHAGKLAGDVASLAGLWLGFVGGAVVASRRHEGLARAGAPADPSSRRSLMVALRDDYGLAVRLWPDVPLGIAVGIACQYLLVPLLELPLLPFVPHLFERLSAPAQSLTGGQRGVGLAVLGVLVCLGSPIVEELFFRGLLLRALGGRLAPVGPRLGPVMATVLTGVVFGLVHFEALQLTALAGFGIVLCALAWRSGRLGPGIVAHAAFNATTFIALAVAH